MEVFVDGTLSYVGYGCQWIPIHVITKYGQSVARADFSENNLINLSELTQFSRLKEVVLDKNNVDDVNVWTLPCLPNLEALSLNKNKITDLENFLDIISKRAPSLKYLSLHGNPLCPDQLTNDDRDEADYKRYRLYTRYRLPTLKALDHRPFNLNEVNEAASKGAFLKTVKPKVKKKSEDSEHQHDIEVRNFKPLSASTGKTSNFPRASFGKCDFVYVGKHSEGNRFIRSKDL